MHPVGALFATSQSCHHPRRAIIRRTLLAGTRMARHDPTDCCSSRLPVVCCPAPRRRLPCRRSNAHRLRTTAVGFRRRGSDSASADPTSTPADTTATPAAATPDSAWWDLTPDFGVRLADSTVADTTVADTAAPAEEAPKAVSPPRGRPRIGLALSGGGARGAAHIGLLQVLEEHRIPIDYIAGTSMGAVIGGLYAAGISPARLDSIVNAMDWRVAFTDRSATRHPRFTGKRDDDVALAGTRRRNPQAPAPVSAGRGRRPPARPAAQAAHPARRVHRRLRSACRSVSRRRRRLHDRRARSCSLAATSPRRCAPACASRPHSRRASWTAGCWWTAASSTTCRSRSRAAWARTSSSRWTSRRPPSGAKN